MEAGKIERTKISVVPATSWIVPKVEMEKQGDKVLPRQELTGNGPVPRETVDHPASEPKTRFSNWEYRPNGAPVHGMRTPESDRYPQ
ncbi:hypothetical protein ACWDT6_19520 [Nocardia grenadensis]|uniref:hypothetical protein n=1 Tax=Nocardia grenadensis TaxID=931537 RepID=UPI003D750944